MRNITRAHTLKTWELCSEMYKKGDGHCMKYEMYGTIHKLAKYLLKRNNTLPDTVKLVDFPKSKLKEGRFPVKGVQYINESAVVGRSVEQKSVYPVENCVNCGLDEEYPISFICRKEHFEYASSLSEAISLWPKFLDASVIPEGYRNEGIHYGGYIK